MTQDELHQYLTLQRLIEHYRETHQLDKAKELSRLVSAMLKKDADQISRQFKFSSYDLLPNEKKVETVIKEFNFGEALDAMKKGYKVARSGWNGKGMWIALSGTGDGPNGGRMTEPQHFWNQHSRAFAELHGPVEVLPTIIMKTAGGQILMGWLASQSDMVAEDWTLVP